MSCQLLPEDSELLEEELEDETLDAEEAEERLLPLDELDSLLNEGEDELSSSGRLAKFISLIWANSISESVWKSITYTVDYSVKWVVSIAVVAVLWPV